MSFRSNFFLSVLVTGLVSTSHAGEITCFGQDDSKQTIIVQFADFDKYGVGILSAETSKGVQVISNMAPITTVNNKKVKLKNSGRVVNYQVDGARVLLNLSKLNRSSYVAELCGPQLNTEVGGVRFINSECLQLECKLSRF